jgi:MYXO-CTERM domain-containing protein
MIAFETDGGSRGWYWVFLAWLIIVGAVEVRRRRRRPHRSPFPVGPGHKWLARQPRSLLAVKGVGAALAAVFAVAEGNLWLLILVAAVVIWAAISERRTSGS